MAPASRLRNRLFRGRELVVGLSSLCIRIGGLGVAFLLGVVLARTLGPAQFGIYGLVISIGALAMTVGLMGTPQLAVREFSARLGSERTDSLAALSRSFLTAVIVASSSLAILAIAIGSLIDRAALPVIIPGAISVPFLAITALAASQLRGLGEMNRGQVMDIFIRPAVALLVVALMVAGGHKIDGRLALWVQTGVAAVAAIVSLVWLKKALPPSNGNFAITPWLAAALPLCMIDLLRQFDGTYGSVLLGWVASDVELGLYRAAVSCSVVVSMPVTILHVIYAPEVAKLIHQQRRSELQQLLGRIAILATAFVGCITAGCLMLGRPLINLVFGSDYDGTWAPLAVLCVAQLGFSLFGMGPILLAMGHRERPLTRIYIISIIGAVIAAAALVRPFGATGVAAGQIVSLGLISALSWRDGRRHLGVDCSIAGAIRR